MNSLRKPVEIKQPDFICTPEAFLSRDERKLPPLTSPNADAFKEWAGGVVVKYGGLNGAYDALLNCVRKYHPDVSAAE